MHREDLISNTDKEELAKFNFVIKKAIMIGNANIFDGYFLENKEEQCKISCNSSILQNYETAKMLLLEKVLKIGEKEYTFSKQFLKEVKYKGERKIKR